MNGPVSRAFLEELYARHHRIENLHPDPLVFARGHRDPRDGEVAGLLAASLAYGQVAKIMEALAWVFDRLGGRPAERICGLEPSQLSDLVEGFSYRFHKSKDLALLLWLIRQALDRWGGLLPLYAAGGPGRELEDALIAFCENILSGDPRPFLRARLLPPAHPVRHLLSSPRSGGASKRLCLYLRWMVRKDELDPGYWHGAVDPARLIVPVDTHVARVSRSLGLTNRHTADWKMALQITSGLREFDRDDPVRFDFSLFRYGVGLSGRKTRSAASRP